MCVVGFIYMERRLFGRLNEVRFSVGPSFGDMGRQFKVFVILCSNKGDPPWPSHIPIFNLQRSVSNVGLPRVVQTGG